MKTKFFALSLISILASSTLINTTASASILQWKSTAQNNDEISISCTGDMPVQCFSVDEPDAENKAKQFATDALRHAVNNSSNHNTVDTCTTFTSNNCDPSTDHTAPYQLIITTPPGVTAPSCPANYPNQGDITSTDPLDQPHKAFCYSTTPTIDFDPN